MSRALWLSVLCMACVSSPGEAKPPPAAVETVAPTPAAAVAAFRAQKSNAAEMLAAAAKAHPLVATALKTLEAEAHLFAGRREPAKHLAREMTDADPRWSARAAWTAAQAAMPDDCKTALTYLERAHPTPPWILGAPRLKLLAAAQVGCGDAAAAAETDRLLATRYPHTNQGQAAEKRVTLTPQDQLVVAASLERARDYIGAQIRLRALLDTPLAEDARFALGKLQLNRFREDFEIARIAFAKVAEAGGAQAEEAKYLVARALGRKGDVVGAIEAFDAYLAAYPKGAFAEDAEFFKAFMRYEFGRYRDAAVGFGRIRKGKWAKSSRWYYGWCLYLAGMHERALPIFDDLAAKNRGSRLGRRATYWGARALEEKDSEAAEARLAALVESAPLSWYALLARRANPETYPNVAGLMPSDEDAPGTKNKAFVEASAEIRALAGAGLHDFARRALRHLSSRMRAADRWDLEMALAREIGDAGQEFRASVTKYHRLFKAPPIGKDAKRWQSAFPRGFRAAVEKGAKAADVPPNLIYSFIRKESAFEPDALSHAHAVGLMQLLPRTARGILNATGRRDKAIPNLFDPETNIELGSWYVGALSSRFRGQLPLTTAAYNAGPESVMGWFKGRHRVETDLFVDTMPFRETRGYVKRMVETLVIYRLVHDGKDLETAVGEVLSLGLDLSVEPGVSF